MTKKLLIPLFIVLLVNNLLSQTINEWSNEMVLWQCPSNQNLKLMYRVNLAEGGYNSLVELLVPNNIESSTISGVLKVEENKSPDNYNSPTTKTETIKINQASIDKQYIFNISAIGQISFDGTCNGSDLKIKVNSDAAEKYDFEGEWSAWTIIWEVKKDTINVQYRTKTYLDKATKKHKTDVEIQGPKIILAEKFLFVDTSKMVMQTNFQRIPLYCPKLEKAEHLQ